MQITPLKLTALLKLQLLSRALHKLRVQARYVMCRQIMQTLVQTSLVRFLIAPMMPTTNNTRTLLKGKRRRRQKRKRGNGDNNQNGDGDNQNGNGDAADSSRRGDGGRDPAGGMFGRPADPRIPTQHLFIAPAGPKFGA